MCSYTRLLLCAFIILLLIPTSSYADEQQTQVLEYRPQARLGLGWNSLTNESSKSRMSCLDSKSYKTEESKRTVFGGNFRLVSSLSDIEDGLGLNASASYRGLVYQASGSIKFAKSQQITSTSTQVAGFATAETRVDSVFGRDADGSNAASALSGVVINLSEIQARLGGLSIAPDKIALLTSGKPEDMQEFMRECGDGFVSDIYYGGRLNIVATLSTQSQSDKQSVEATLKGGGAGVDIGIEGLVTAAKKEEVTNFSSNYLIVGTDGSGGSFTDIDGMKIKFNEFSNKAYQHDAPIRIWVTSYATLLPNSESYRFGVAKEAIEAARLVNELTSVSQTLVQMHEDQLNSPLLWDRSVGKSCIARKQGEIIQHNQALMKALNSCKNDTESSASPPKSCSSALDSTKANIKAEDVTCPLTPKLVNNRISEFDYRLFYPALGTPNSCAPLRSSEVREKVSTVWIKPRWEEKCRSDPNQYPELCTLNTLDILQKNIHVPDRGLPPLPSGGYKRSCKKNPCKLRWNAQDNKGEIQCTCKNNGEASPTKWIKLQCPQKAPLQNCHGVLRYGKRCP